MKNTTYHTNYKKSKQNGTQNNKTVKTKNY